MHNETPLVFNYYKQLYDVRLCKLHLTPPVLYISTALRYRRLRVFAVVDELSVPPTDDKSLPLTLGGLNQIKRQFEPTAPPRAG